MKDIPKKRGLFGENSNVPLVSSTEQVVHFKDNVGTTLDEIINDIDTSKVGEVYMSDGGTLTPMTTTDENGKKITILPKDQFGKVGDVKLNGVSILNSENVANINIAASVSNTTGTPTVNPVVNGGNVTLNFSGIKGEPGDNAILLEGESPLAQVLSQADDKAITPKAVSDVIGYGIFNNSATYSTKPSSTVSIGSQSFSPKIPTGTKLRLTMSGIGTICRAWRLTLKDSASGSQQYVTNPTNGYVDIVASFDIGFVNFQVLAANWITTGTVSVSVEKFGIRHEIETNKDNIIAIQSDVNNRFDAVGSELDALDGSLSNLQVAIDSATGQTIGSATGDWSSAIPSGTVYLVLKDNNTSVIPQGKTIRFTIETGVGEDSVIKRWSYRLNGNASSEVFSTKSVLDLIVPYDVERITLHFRSADFNTAGIVTASVELVGEMAKSSDVDEIKETLDEFADDLGNLDSLTSYNAAISKEIDAQKIVPEVSWNEGRLFWIGAADTSATTAKYSTPIEVKRNDVIRVRAYKPDKYTFMVAWVVSEDKVYDGISKYGDDNGWYDKTFRASKDGHISVCLSKNYTPTIEIWRGVDACVENVMPNYLKTEKGLLFQPSINLFSPANAYNGLRLTDANTPVSFGTVYWSTGFIEIPADVKFIRLNYFPEKAYAYNENGLKLGNIGVQTPIDWHIDSNGVRMNGVKYVRFSFPKATIAFESRSRLMVTDFRQETDNKPGADLNSSLINMRDSGIFQLSDLASKSAELVFGAYVDETTFNVDGEPLEELSQNKVYIDSTTWVLYRWDGEALTKACMWTDRGKVFTQDFSFAIPKTWHKENMIITATAKWVGREAPTIRMITSPNGGQGTLAYTMRYLIGAKDNYSTKEWRPYNPLIHQDKIKVEVTIPSGTTLMVDEFTNYYSNRKERGTFPQFHFRSGNGLNQGMTAWEEAAKLGYEYIIVIPKVTADGKWIVYHGDGSDKMGDLYYENGTKISSADGNHFVSEYTYDELLQYDIAKGLPYSGNKLPLLEDFFAMCAKRGIHPCFSVHPNFTTEEWEKVRELSDKWGVTKHLNIKAGFMGPVIANCYSVFGDDIESYMTDMNTSGITSRDTNPQTVVNETLAWSANIDKTKVRVGIEYFPAYAQENWIKAAIDAGLCAGVVTSNPNQAGSGGDTAADILSWIEMGVSSFTDVINPSVGLNW